MKREAYAKQVGDLLIEYIRNGDHRKISYYLVHNSNLPGPRGNLELAYAFADSAEALSASDVGHIWPMILKFAEIGADEAPVGDPREFVAFCGALAIGAIGSVQSTYRQQALSRLRELASDRRWRTREAVAMGIQRLMMKDSGRTLNDLMGWVEDEEWLQMRAVAAGVAEPALLKDVESARAALEIHRAIFSRLVNGTERRSEGFKVLRQGLAYTLSVVVSSIPDEGFRFMRQLAESGDEDVNWILKENLKKSRLTKKYSEDVQKIMKIINEKGT